MNLKRIVRLLTRIPEEGGFLSQLTEECRDSIDGLVENFSCGSVYEVSDDIRSLDRVLQKVSPCSHLTRALLTDTVLDQEVGRDPSNSGEST